MRERTKRRIGEWANRGRENFELGMMYYELRENAKDSED